MTPVAGLLQASDCFSLLGIPQKVVGMNSLSIRRRCDVFTRARGHERSFPAAENAPLRRTPTSSTKGTENDMKLLIEIETLERQRSALPLKLEVAR
jgi:hypothetical protein